MTSAPHPADPELAEATVSEFDGVRYLHLGTEWIQGAMRVRQPLKLELEYIQRMMAWMLWRAELPADGGHAVQLGLGAAAITRFTHQVLHWRTTVVELNPSVIQACRLLFKLPPDDDRLRVFQTDAAWFVRQPELHGAVDALCVDLYDHDAAAPVLDDADFYTACRGMLAPGGLMSVNLFGRQASLARSLDQIAQAFGTDQMWQVRATKEGNTVVVAGHGVVVPDRAELIRRATLIEMRFGLPARQWLRMVKPVAL